MNINEDYQPEEDNTQFDIKHLQKQQWEFRQVKCFWFVHAAAEDIGPVSQEAIYCFHQCPFAHCRWYTTLVCKLELVEPKGFTEQVDGDPVQQFQYERGNTDSPVVLWRIDTGQLVLDDWHQHCQKHELWNMCMNKEALDHHQNLLKENTRVNLEIVRGETMWGITLSWFQPDSSFSHFISSDMIQIL